MRFTTRDYILRQCDWLDFLAELSREDAAVPKYVYMTGAEWLRIQQ